MSAVPVFARISSERKKRLYHKLIDNGETYAQWLCRMIDKETKVKQEPSWKRRLKGKEA